MISLLLERKNNSSQLLRKHFVFYIIPLLNPDGVYRGHYRTDNSGTNLNRCYINPNQAMQPSIFCAKELILQIHQIQGLAMYLDLHAHAGKKGCFIFGNQLDFRNQIETCLFTKLLSLNSQIFDHNLCNFTEQNMYAKDKNDNGITKEGSGRVSIYKATNVVLCYTLECNYNMSEKYNILFPYSSAMNDDQKIVELNNDLQNIIITDKISEKLYSNQQTEPYTMESYEELGKDILLTLLDYYQLNSICRYHQSPFQSLRNIKLHLAVQIMKNSPFRFDPFLRKFLKNFNQDKNVLQTLKSLFIYLEKNIKVDNAIFEEKKSKSEKKKLKNGGAVIKPSNQLKKVNIIFSENSFLANSRQKKELPAHLLLCNYTKSQRGQLKSEEEVQKIKFNSALAEFKRQQNKSQGKYLVQQEQQQQQQEKKKFEKLPQLARLPPRNDQKIKNNNHNINRKLNSLKI